MCLCHFSSEFQWEFLASELMRIMQSTYVWKSWHRAKLRLLLTMAFHSYRYIWNISRSNEKINELILEPKKKKEKNERKSTSRLVPKLMFISVDGDDDDVRCCWQITKSQQPEEEVDMATQLKATHSLGYWSNIHKKWQAKWKKWREREKSLVSTLSC